MSRELGAQKLALLNESVQLPWASISQLAVRACLEPSLARDLCAHLVQDGLMQVAPLNRSRYPKALYAPTDSGVSAVAEALGISPAKLAAQVHLTEARFWALRSGWEVAQEVNAMCLLTQRALAPARVEWEAFVERRMNKQRVFLHGRLALFANDGVRTFYLLNERGDPWMWQWYRTFKYLHVWAKRLGGQFPSLLLVATRAFGAQAMLSLNRMAGGELAVFASHQRAEALTGGLTAVTWRAMLPDLTLAPADPFAATPIPASAYEGSVHAIRHIVPSESGRCSRRYPWRGFSLTSLPQPLQRLPDLDGLNDPAHRTLAFLVHHPVCPTTTVAEFVEMRLPDVLACLTQLEQLGFVERISLHERERLWLPAPEQNNCLDLAREVRIVWAHVRRQPDFHVADVARELKMPIARLGDALKQLASVGLIESTDGRPEFALWAATDVAVALCAARALQPTGTWLKRHHFFCADHRRRQQHTREVYAFFEMLHRRCVERSWATRQFDAPESGVNQGEIPFFELGSFDAEMTASDWYIYQGHTHCWRPDGFGVLRAGATYTPFWLEMDGTIRSRSRRDAATWEDKLGRLCDYYTSNHWQLRHQSFPRLLIVSSDVRNRRMIGEALIAAARARNMAPPLVLVAGREAVAQRGPLGPIWFRVEPNARSTTYGFEGIEPDVVVTAPRRRNLLDDLARAEHLGLLDLPAPLRLVRQR